MKKILIIIMILLFIVGMQHTVIKQYTHTDKNTAPTDNNAATQDENEKMLSSSITITAVGDCTLATDINAVGSGSFEAEVKNNNYDYSYFFKNVKKYFESDDITIVNFEGVLSDRGSRADKTFAFRGSPDYVNIISDSSVEAANLANNHSRDYGMDAYDDTKKIISEKNIAPFGWDDYSVIEVNGVKVGLIGTNALNSVGKEKYPEIFENLKKESPDLIIANFHWGVEKASTPNNEQIELAYYAIDNGADLVIGHHPHVLQGIEKYKGKYIVYSLGNFCFGGNKNPSDKDCMIFQQTFTFKNGELSDNDEVTVIPCSISSVSGRNNYQPTPVKDTEYDRIKNKIIDRSSSFSDTGNINFVQGE